MPKHKKTGFSRVIAVGICIIVLAAAAGGWFLFSVLDRSDPLDAVPAGFLLFARTDSLKEFAEPLLDMHALDVLFSAPEMGDLRTSLHALRTSELRDSALFHTLASRRIDLALYADRQFCAVVHMGALSGITRMAPLFAGFLKIERLSFVRTAGISYFKYDAGNTVLYIAAKKDLLFATSSLELLKKMAAGGSGAAYSPQMRAQLEKKPQRSFRVSVDVPFLLQAILLPNTDSIMQNLYNSILPLLQPNMLGSVQFDINDQEAAINVDIPLAGNMQETASPLGTLFAVDSSIPALPGILPDTVQYYTLLNAGSVKELKESLFPLLQPGMDIDSIWAKADAASRGLLGLNLEQLLFSWTGRELAVFGMEINKEPVFAIKISDEQKRRQIFDTAFSSFILNDNRSLILDGIRMPRIEIPGFIDSILKLFNVNMIKPYYIVIDDFIYFSQSAENLSALYSSTRTNGNRLSATENWKKTTKGQPPAMTMGLFYNLERSIPFFLKSGSPLSQMLSLYNTGKADVRVQDGTLSASLQAAANSAGSIRSVPGFPVKLEGNITQGLTASPAVKNTILFYMEDDKQICSFNPVNGRKHTFTMESGGWICAADTPINRKNTGVLWAVSRSGLVYLFTEELEMVEGFPLMTGLRPSAPPAAARDKLFIPVAGGSLYQADGTGAVQIHIEDLPGELKATPSVYGDVIALYTKRLIGQIVLLQSSAQNDPLAVLPVTGIAFGSPALMQNKGTLLAGFITQSGHFSVWDVSGTQLSKFPVKLTGLYYGNAVSNGTYFYALSAEGTLSRISPSGEVMQVDIQHLSAKEPILAALDYNGDGTQEIFLSGDANLVYGFTENLELLPGFPVIGHGIPVFMDINGGKTECLVVSLDNTIAAWNIP